MVWMVSNATRQGSLHARSKTNAATGPLMEGLLPKRKRCFNSECEAQFPVPLVLFDMMLFLIVSKESFGSIWRGRTQMAPCQGK